MSAPTPDGRDDRECRPDHPEVPEPFAWHYGPTSGDPDPGKMWHYDCGGEVWGFKEGYICGKCEKGADL